MRLIGIELEAVHRVADGTASVASALLFGLLVTEVLPTHSHQSFTGFAAVLVAHLC